MSLYDLGIPENKIQQLVKAGISSIKDLLNYWPKKYNDRSQMTGIRNKDQESVFVMHVNNVKLHHYTKIVVQANGFIADTGEAVRVTWFNQEYIYWSVKDCEGIDVLVCGKVSYNDGEGRFQPYYQVLSPQVFTTDIKSNLRIYPVYKKVKGMSDEYLIGCIQSVIESSYCFSESIPEKLLKEHHLLSRDKMIRELHQPTSGASLWRKLKPA